VHPFWSSHEEKRDCVRLSMEGQPWLSSRSINGGMASSWERKEREGEGEQGGHGKGGLLGGTMGRGRAAGGAYRRGAGPCCCYIRSCCT
jgi:hypothetical protein